MNFNKFIINTDAVSIAAEKAPNLEKLSFSVANYNLLCHYCALNM